MPRPQCYILSGGKSRRFGSDKARHEIDGKTLIASLRDQLSQWSGAVFAVADRGDKYADLQIPTFADCFPGAGPLAGIHAALTHAATETNLNSAVIISCDMTEVRSLWLDQLWSAHHSTPQALITIFAEKVSDGPTREHPFPGCYHISLIERIEQQLVTGDRSCRALFSDLDESCQRLPLPDDWPSIPQVNTLEQVAEWRKIRGIEEKKL